MKNLSTVIRKGVFETNSSSMHSITISDASGVLPIVPLDEDGITLTVDCNYDFQWNEETYTDAMPKMAYCILDGVNTQMLENVIKDQTGAKVIKYINEGHGSIDHQSIGTTRRLNSEDSIRNFIFSPNSELVIDNDNH